MKRAWMIAALVLLAGCEPRAGGKVAATTAAADPHVDFDIEKLFTLADGCSVYRFHDNFRYWYFADCSGSISGTVPSGKTSYPVEIPTAK